MLRSRMADIGAVWLRWLGSFIWGAAVLLLPITSLPWLIDWSGASTVAPVSIVFLFALGLFWLVPYLFRGGEIPREIAPFGLFLLFVILSWALSFYRLIPSFRDRSPVVESLEAFITLAMAAATYLITSAWIFAKKRYLHITLVLINASGFLLLVWSTVQAVYVIFYNSHYPFDLIQLQNFFSARHNPLFWKRVTGFAYEPSWLAHQLNLIYLAYWLAASVRGYSVHRRRLWKISIENILLIWGLFILFESFSRVGWLSFFVMIAVLAVEKNLVIARKTHHFIFTRLRIRAAFQRIARPFFAGILLIIFFATYLAAGVGLLYVGSKYEPRLQRFFSKDLLKAGGMLELTNDLFFAERAVYWTSGWYVFDDHPILGVGIGNLGYYFPQKMPAFGWGLTEVLDLFNRFSVIPNSKSMWVRIAAENGMVGLVLFLTWYAVLLSSAWALRKAKDPTLQTLGLFGQLMLIGFIVEGFSVDSYALPYFWFSAGFLTAAAGILRKDLFLHSNI